MLLRLIDNEATEREAADLALQEALDCEALIRAYDDSEIRRKALSRLQVEIVDKKVTIDGYNLNNI